MNEWKILRVDPLPVVGRPSADLSHPHRWIEVVIEDAGAPFPPGLRLETTAGGATLRCPAEALREAGKLSLLAVVKDVASTVRASIRLLAGDRILAEAEFETGPVPHFEYHLMPSSHLCFGYFTGLPEHWEAFRSLRDAVQLISEDDHYTYNVEFLYGLKNLLHKRPQLQETVKRFIRQGRLDISPTLAPSYADFYEGESYIRQFAESQWWLRRRLGAQGRVLYSCDSPGFDPQMPQILDKCGISFFWRGRYGGIYPRPSGSQLLDVEGADGTRHPSFVPQEGVLAGYTTPTISALWRTDELIEGRFAARSRVVRQTAASIRAVLAAWGAPYVGHAAARDQAESRRALINRVAAWNRSFVTPQARFNTLSRFSDRVASDTRVRRDHHQGYLPHFALNAHGMYPIMEQSHRAGYALAAAEKAAALDYCVTGALYPRDLLSALWSDLLFTQQHEQIGWSGDETIQHTRDILRRVQGAADDVSVSAAQRIASKIAFRREDPAVAVFNLLNWERRDVVQIPLPGSVSPDRLALTDSAGSPVPHELGPDGALRFSARVPAMGYETFYLTGNGKSEETETPLRRGRNSIENEFYRVRLDPVTGFCESLYDKTLGIELVDGSASFGAGELLIEEDSGRSCIDFDPTGREYRSRDHGPAEIRVRGGAVSASMEVRRPLLTPKDGPAFFGGYWSQRCVLYAGLRRVDFFFRWHWDNRPMHGLRWFFPLNLEDPEIVFDTLFATQEQERHLTDRLGADEVWLAGEKARADRDARMTGRFLSARDRRRDFCVTVTPPKSMMRFDRGVLCAQLSSNCSIYAPTFNFFPGEQEAQLSLTSHAGDWKSGRDWRFGWEHLAGWNRLLPIVPDRRYDILPERASLMAVGPDNVVLSALKLSQVGEDLVARAYEAEGRPVNMTCELLAPFVTFRPYELALHRRGGAPLIPRKFGPLPVVDAWETNLLEDNLKQLDREAPARGLPLAAGEIKTLRLVLPEVRRGDVSADLGERTVYRLEKAPPEPEGSGGEPEEPITGTSQYLGVG